MSNVQITFVAPNKLAIDPMIVRETFSFTKPSAGGITMSQLAAANDGPKKKRSVPINPYRLFVTNCRFAAERAE